MPTEPPRDRILTAKDGRRWFVCGWSGRATPLPDKPPRLDRAAKSGVPAGGRGSGRLGARDGGERAR